MNEPFLVPCLVTLRTEFNRVSPTRDKGADGWIGDAAHKRESSDHNPDETGSTPFEDADDTDEVHALDIDCTGPWPDGRGGQAGGWFDDKIASIVAAEKRDYESPTIKGRLQNVIWRGWIASRSNGWKWVPYFGASQHFDHAHFSARYLTETENDTRPWGVASTVINKGEDVEQKDIDAIVAALKPSFDLNLTAVRQTAQSVLAARDSVTALSTAVTGAFAKLAAQVDQVDDETIAGIFQGSDEQLIPVLREALGAERLRALASKVLAAG